MKEVLKIFQLLLLWWSTRSTGQPVSLPNWSADRIAEFRLKKEYRFIIILPYQPFFLQN